MKYTHTRLLVDDFPGMFRFYRDQLGLIPTSGGEEDVYAEFATGGSTIALFGRAFMAEALHDQQLAEQSTRHSAMVMTFEVDDVVATYKRLKASGVTCVADPQPRPEWMIFTAHVRDPEGNLIELNSPLQQS